MLKTYIEEIIQFLVNYDIKFHQGIEIFLKAYSFPKVDHLFFIANIAYFIKIAVYTFVILFPLTFVKVAFSEKRLINLTFWILLATFALSGFGVVLAFLQLAFM